MTHIVRRTALMAGAAVLLGLAAFGAVQARSTVGAAAAPGPATLADAAQPAADATSADAAISAGLDAVLAADQTAAPAQDKALRLRRVAAWRHLVHATVVVDLPKKGLTTIQLDRGTISAVTSTSLTIAEAGGGSVTVSLGSGTRVRRLASKAVVTDLKVGDAVFAMSKVEASGTNAYLVVVPKA